MAIETGLAPSDSQLSGSPYLGNIFSADDEFYSNQNGIDGTLVRRTILGINGRNGHMEAPSDSKRITLIRMDWRQDVNTNN